MRCGLMLPYLTCAIAKHCVKLEDVVFKSTFPKMSTTYKISQWIQTISEIKRYRSRWIWRHRHTCIKRSNWICEWEGDYSINHQFNKHIHDSKKFQNLDISIFRYWRFKVSVILRNNLFMCIVYLIVFVLNQMLQVCWSHSKQGTLQHLNTLSLSTAHLYNTFL